MTEPYGDLDLATLLGLLADRDAEIAQMRVDIESLNKAANYEVDRLFRELEETKLRLEGERRITAAYSERARTHRCIPLAGGPDSSVSINTSGVRSGGEG